ncbi:MAG: peroxiredoxin [Acidobacteriota bacterium]
MVQEGDRFPDPKLPDQGGIERCFDDLVAANGLVLYVYPRDATPGCTTQATEFRDLLADFHRLGYEVVGLSRDSAESHCKFITKHDLPFTLLTDADTSFMAHLGAWGEKKMYGRVSEGVIRSTFVVNREGVIRKIYRNVRAKGHARRVLEDLGAATP